MSEPKRKPPKLGPKKAAPTTTQKTSTTPATRPATTAGKPKPKPSEDREQKPANVTKEPSSSQQKTDPLSQPQKTEAAPNKAPSTAASQATKPPPASRKTSTTSAKPPSTEERKPSKLPPRPSNFKPNQSSDEKRSSTVSRKASTPANQPESTQPKRKPPKLPPKTNNNTPSTAKSEGTEPKRKPPKLPPKANDATPPTQSRRPSAAPRGDSKPSVNPAQKTVKEEQDLKSLLSEEQRTDLSQLVAGIARQMRKTIEDNFDPAANLKTLGQKELSEDEKIASAEFDTGTVDVGAYDKERKLKQEREKELATPKFKELKQASLEWFDEWQDVVQKRVDETLEPKNGVAQDKDALGPSIVEERPIQKVNTGAKSGEYIPPKLEELFPRLQTSLTKLPMQKRILVLHSVLLLLLSLEHYNAASRVLLLYLSSSLKLGLKYLREDEEKTAQGLLQAAKEVTADEETLQKRKEEGKEAHKWRVRLATAAGAGVVGVAGGLAAPMIAAGVGTVMGGLGLEASTAAGYLGSLAGSSYLVGGLFGAYGGRMTGEMMEELSAEVEDFAFLPVHGERKVHDESINAATESRRLRVIVAISGWLLEKEEVVTPWRVLKPTAEVFALRFELEALMKLGQSIDTMVSSAAYGYAQSAMIQRTVFAELMSAMWPVALVKVARVVDNPFTLAKTRADKAGRVLAEALINRTQGERPVTLIGYSLGARVIWSCLTTLSEKKAFGLVESAVLMGSPLPSDTSTWRMMRTAVSGRLVNVYSENDYLLAFLYRTSSLQYGVAGLMPVSGLHGLENVDVSETVSGHLRYRYLVGSILQKIGFEDIDKDEVDKEAEAFKKIVEEESKHSYIEQAKEGYKGNKIGKAPKLKAGKDLSDADADKQATAMEKEVQAKTQKGLMQWAVEQLYIAKPSAPSPSDVKGAASDPQAATKGAAKTARKTTDAATKSLYQRAIEAAYLARSGGEEGQKVAQDKLAEAQVGGPSSYLATAAGYLPTSYIPSLGRSGLGRSSDAASTPQKTLGQAGKPPLKKTDSAQKAVGNAAKPALKKTNSVQNKVGSAAKDPTKAATDAQNAVTNATKDPSQVASNAQKQVKDTTKGVTDTASSAASKAGETASDPSKVAAESQEKVGDLSKSVTDTASKAGTEVEKTASDPSKGVKEGQKQIGDAAKKASGVTSYIPSFGLGGSSKKDKQTTPKEASSTPSKSDDTAKNSKSLAQRAEEAVAAENKAASDSKKANESGKKKISNESRPQKTSTDNPPEKSSGYSSYLPHFGFGGSKSKPATPDTDKSTKEAPKPEQTAKDAAEKTEDASKEVPKTASEGTGEAQSAASDMTSKAKDTGEDIFTSPPSKASNAFTKAASSATGGLTNAANSATDTASNAAGSAANSASGAGKTVADGAKSAEKYTPSMGGLGGDAGSKIGEMAGGAASGAKSGASFLGKGVGSVTQSAGDAQSKRGEAADDVSKQAGDEVDKAVDDKEGKEDGAGYGKMAGGLAGIGSRDKMVGGAVSQAGKGLSSFAGGEGEEKGTKSKSPAKESEDDDPREADGSDADKSGDSNDSEDDMSDEQSQVTEIPSRPVKMQEHSDGGEEETPSDYNSASEEVQSDDEGSHKAEGTPSSEEKKNTPVSEEDKEDALAPTGEDEERKPSSQSETKDEPAPQEKEGETSNQEAPKADEPKSYLGSAGSAVSSAGQGVVGGVSSAGSAAGGAASSTASGVAGGVGKIGKGFGWR